MKNFQIMYIGILMAQMWYVIVYINQHIKKAMSFFLLCKFFLLDYKQKEFHYTSFASLSLL
jgi:hypothetical protein